MKQKLKRIRMVPVGAAYAVLVVALSQWTIRNLGVLFGKVGEWVGMDSWTLTDIVHALNQLREAQIRSPWLLALVIGIVLGLLARRRTGLQIALWVILLLPLTLLAMWFTVVNDIRVGALLSSLLSLLPDLM